MSATLESEKKRVPYLPSDIIHTIVETVALEYDIENLDPWTRSQRRLGREFYCKDLLSLRAVCREFCWISSPRVFRTLWLTHTLKSTAGFLDIIQSPWVNPCVQSVKYQYWNPEPFRYEKASENNDKTERKACAAEIRQQLSHALSRLHEFPMLKSLSIRFGKIAPGKTKLDRIRDDLSSILDALVTLGTNLTHSLESLSLTRLPPIHLEQYDSPAFLALRANLSLFEVHLASMHAWSSLVTPPLPEGLISPCEPFYYDTLPGRLLPPPSAATGLENLEALALCFSDHTGVFYITYSFAKLHFPRLRALRLQHVQFSIACDAENFILQHADTLLELHLLHCQIAVPSNDEESTGAPNDSEFNDWPQVPRPWLAIYAELSKKLQRLVFLDVQDAWWISYPDRYVTYAPGEIMQFFDESRDDDKYQLEIFRKTVRDRADKSATEYEPSFPIPDQDEFICDCH